jgi:hypothetical protein
MATNADIESDLARKLGESLHNLGILPRGYHCEVNLQRRNRKKRRDVEFKTNWNPETDSIRISFSLTEQPSETGKIATSSESPTPTAAEDRLSDMLRALDRAETRPGYEFVSLKWFRDTALVHEGFPWAADDLARHDVLCEAIDRRWILTSKIANPRPPHFPVTAIRLNRQMLEVAAAIGSRTGSLPEFRPVSLRGEALSATVLHDRR